MKSVSLPVSLKPILAVLFISGLSTLPGRSLGKCCLLRHAVNTCMATIFCAVICLSMAGEFFEATGTRSIGSWYLIIYQLGEIALLVVYRCNFHSSFRRFLNEFEFYQRQYGRSEVNYRSVFFVGILAIASFIGSIGLSVNLSVTTQLPGAFESPFHSSSLKEAIIDFNRHPIFSSIAVVILCQILSGAFWFYVVVWIILQLEAKDILKSLTQEEKTTLKEKPEIIEKIRLRHADLSYLIGRANDFVRHILAVFYGIGIPCVLLIIHGFINSSLDVYALIGMTNFSFFLVFQLTFITLSGASLNSKMHKPIDFLFQLDVNEMSGRGTEIVSAFVSRIQGVPIGFRVYNLFTLDSSTIMMICGTLATYTLVIVEFQPGGLTGQSSSTENQPMDMKTVRTNYSTVTETTHP